MPTIPTPKKYFPFGHLSILTKGAGGCFIDSLNKIHNDLGKIYSLSIVGRNWIVCSDPVIMKKALLENIASFPKGATLEVAHSLDIGKLGLTETEGIEWQQQHKLLNPFFTNKSVHSTYEQIQSIMDKALNYLQANNELDILDFCNRVSFTFMTKMSTAYESKCLDDKKNIDPLFKLQSYVVNQFLKRLKYGACSRFLPTISNVLYKKRLLEYRNLFKKIIANFKENHAHRDDIILYHLINGKYGERELIENEIIDQIYTVIGAGYESTGSSFHWLLYELSRRQDLIIKLREEISPLGHHDNWNSETIASCSLLQATLQEVFRLHQAFPIIGREVVQDLVINDYQFTKKSFAFFSIWRMHRSSFWGENPDEFMPERFFDSKILKGYKDHFFPFGIGPRKCIGEKMARSELAIMLMRILIEFDIELMPNQKIIPFQSLSKISKYGINMRFIKRDKV